MRTQNLSGRQVRTALTWNPRCIQILGAPKLESTKPSDPFCLIPYVSAYSSSQSPNPLCFSVQTSDTFKSWLTPNPRRLRMVAASSFLLSPHFCRQQMLDAVESFVPPSSLVGSKSSLIPNARCHQILDPSKSSLPSNPSQLQIFPASNFSSPPNPRR